MERKLLTQRGRKLYGLRGQTVEPVFGQNQADARRRAVHGARRTGGQRRMESALQRAQSQKAAPRGGSSEH